jgi:hypothetical protein
MAAAAPDAQIYALDEPEFTAMVEEFGMYLESEPAEVRENHEDAPRTVSEALERAKMSSEHLVFLPSADRSAAASPFIRPGDVLAVLATLDELAGRFAADDLPEGLETACATSGLNFASGISSTTRQQYGGSYEVTYNGSTVMLGPHARLGHGSGRTCARIYWHVDSQDRRIVIGHVGRHLPDVSSQSWN